MSELTDILASDDPRRIRALFCFAKDDPADRILFKFNLWARYFFPKYFTSPDAKFHAEIDTSNLDIYCGRLESFVDLAFRGAAKTSRTKLFLAYCISNDINHHRRYFKVISEDGTNSKQIVTDIYNMFVSHRVSMVYPEIFGKTVAKREETMESFTTATGIKFASGIVGSDQRGAIQEDSRPDFLWCHKKGTIIKDCKWMRVEDHPSFSGYRKEFGLDVRLKTLPFSETVTKEHRYWVKSVKTARRKGDKTEILSEGWKEAQDIRKGDYIGLRIDMNTCNVPSLEKFIPSLITERNKFGQIERIKNGRVFAKCDLLEDKEWWWLLGIFWGDGNLGTKKPKGSNSSIVCLTIADDDNKTQNRVVRLLEKYDIRFSQHPYKGCHRLQFSCAVLSRLLRNWYIGGNSQKVPSEWVEYLDLEKQKELVFGYIDADGWVDKKNKCVRLTSVCLPGLLMARRILARFGIASSIRKNNDAKIGVNICGKICNTQKKYDLRFRDGAGLLGFHSIKSQTRYTYPETFVDGGFLWSKVDSIKESLHEELFCPIFTETHDYITDFGLSHNCEDFENRKTLRSARHTIAIWENMEEARTSLAKGGGAIYTANYISEQGNVHKLVTKESPRKRVLIIPIEDGHHEPTWARYSKDDIAQMRIDDDDFEGERLCKPSSAKDIMFDREILDAMKVAEPIKASNGFRMYRKFDPSHRYAGGHDIAGGVGLDSSASVFIDFDMFPAQVVGVFADNQIKPEVFGHEIRREAEMFGDCLVAPERNYGTEAILVLRQLGANVFSGQRKDTKIGDTASEYGWNTNALTKPKMLFAFGKAIEDGLISLNDKALIAEAKAYTRNDLLETIKDPRLTTRHFDILMAACIAWQMKDHAKNYGKDSEKYDKMATEYIQSLGGDNVQKVFSLEHFDRHFPGQN